MSSYHGCDFSCFNFFKIDFLVCRLVARHLLQRLLYPTHLHGIYIYKHFTRCRVGLPVAIIGMVEAEVATYLQPARPQQPSGSNEGGWHREGLPPISTQWHYAAS